MMNSEVIDGVERPAGHGEQRPVEGWSSDAVAEMLRRLELPFISLNPGASYRGLHDSLVNYLGNERPQMVVCLHEEHAVALAHGYAKVTGRPMAVALHSNVGLMHATMALYNAFCDRVPMVVLGATGPVDAAKRRPWIDWIHTAADQGALIRPYVKFDDQPASVPAAIEALLRGHQLTTGYPQAPVYVCLDAALQESALGAPPEYPELDRFRPPSPPSPGPAETAAALQLLREARNPVLLMGRVSRDELAWQRRVALAEALDASVLTDLKVAAAFPTTHPLHAAAPGTFLTASGKQLLAVADVVLSLDWVDVAGTLAQAASTARVISCTLDHTLHNGWSKDHFALAPADVAIAAHPDRLVETLLTEIESSAHAADTPARTHPTPPPRAAAPQADRPHDAPIAIRELSGALTAALAGGPVCQVRQPLGFDGSDLIAEHPLDYLGQDGGAGLGSGPGQVVGAALALRDDPRLAVAVLGDGDTLMGASALWTAAHYGLALLVVVANNRSFFNDEVHQEQVARARDRPVANRWIGQHIREPEPDLAALARSLGLTGIGPVTDPGELVATLQEAVAAARAGEAVLVDVHVASDGYPGGPANTSSE